MSIIQKVALSSGGKIAHLRSTVSHGVKRQVALPEATPRKTLCSACLHHVYLAAAVTQCH